jgi:protein-disulfide isomerase
MNDQNSNQRGFFDGNPKQMFVFGIVTGMVLMLLLNSFTGVSFAANGGSNNGGRQPVATGTTNTGTGTAPTPSGTLAEVQKDEHIRGDVNKAKVVMIEYSDFQCPFCERHHPNLQKIADEYGDQIAWVYRHFPLTSIHPNAEPAALASECASEQGKFWEFADAMFAGQTANLEADAASATAFETKTAKDLGLNMTKYNDCVSSKKYQAVVDSDAASGDDAGVTGTPATFINGTMVSGAVPYATLKQMVDTAIAGS